MKEKFSRILFMMLHTLPWFVGLCWQKEWDLSFLPQQAHEQAKTERKELSDQLRVTTLLTTQTVSYYCLEQGKNRRKSQPCNERTGHQRSQLLQKQLGLTNKISPTCFLKVGRSSFKKEKLKLQRRKLNTYVVIKLNAVSMRMHI